MYPSERAELEGQMLAGYLIGPRVGIGGTGVVLEATRMSDGTAAVIKTLRPNFLHNPDIARRLRREAEVARNVVHPGMVDVLDQGFLEDGSPFVVMERIRGECLARYLKRNGPMKQEHVAVIAFRVAAILHASHSHGYVHRDVKPEHIILDRAENGSLQVYLLDFGVCAADTADEEDREAERGRVFGTPSYSSPEQACGEPYVDGRADLFSLGIVMFECLTGRLPFSAPNVSALLRRIIREDAPRASLICSNVDSDFDDIVALAMARDKRERFTTARTFARELLDFIGDRIRTERGLAATLQLTSDEAGWLHEATEVDINAA